jgi:uncharacterized repeat protein (TIGR03803 family)
MYSKQQSSSSLSRTIEVAATATLGIAIVFALTVVLTQSAQAQTFNVIYAFTGEQNGVNPHGNMAMDGEGNLYGVAGAIFELKHSPSGWIYKTLYPSWLPGDGDPNGVVIGPDGSLYGTTFDGGGDGCDGFGCGTVFSLKSPSVPPNVMFHWGEFFWVKTVLHRFTGGADGVNPISGDVVFDPAGNLYGTTASGGTSGAGVVFELSPSQGGWTETIIHSFSGQTDGGYPSAGVIFDRAGSLYGATGFRGIYNCGTIFQLTPSESGWQETTLYTFENGDDGCSPLADLILDQSGKLYGTTYVGGPGGIGTVFMLAPSGGEWTFNLLYGFSGNDGVEPYVGLVMDMVGNLYGTTLYGGTYNCGTAFKLSPSDGGWTHTTLHDFTCGSDGWQPWGRPILDGNGNLYGTTWVGGAHGYGVIWEITP